MKLLNKLTINNLKLNKKRTAVTIVGIILSVALLTAVASIYESGIKSLTNLVIRESGNYHVEYVNVPTNELDTFKNNRYIEEISITQDVGYANIQSENKYKPYVFIKKFNKEALKNLSINLVEGKLPENESEIIISTHLKTNGRNFLKVGDTITLNVGQRVDSKGSVLNQHDSYKVKSTEEQEKIIDTTSVTYKVVGIIERPSDDIENFSAPGYTFITYFDDSKLMENFDVYVRYTKEGTKNWTTVTANILGVDSELFKLSTYIDKNLNEETLNKINVEMQKAKYKIISNRSLIGLETDPNSASGINGLKTVFYIVLGIIVFTSVFCIKNSFDISITEKIKQYGMLRSIGATKKQIKRNVLFEATILGAIGIPLGLLFGCFASFILIIVSNYFLADGYVIKLVLSISPISILVAVLLGIVTIYFSAFKSAKRASKVSPISSIRNSANIKIDSKKIKSPKIISKIFGIGGEISYKNLKRNKKKYRTTVISLIVSVLVFIALSSFMSMTFDEADRELKTYDYNISLSCSINDKVERYNKCLSTTKLDSISNYTVLRQMEYEVNDVEYNNEYLNWLGIKYDDLVREDKKTYINVYALGKEQYSKYVKSLGLNYNDIKDKAIVMDYARIGRTAKGSNKNEFKTLRVYDYKPDDAVINKNTNQSLQIGYVTDVKPFGLKNNDSQYLVVSDEMFDSLLSGKLASGVDIFYLSKDANKLQDDIDSLLKIPGEPYYSVKNIEEKVKTRNNIFTLVGIFLYGFIIVITLIAVTNIFNTITTNMELRKPEFAMLKSVGMTSKEFNRMIRLETLFMGIKSLLIGLPIGIILSYLIYFFLAKDSGNPYKLPIISIIMAIIGVYLLISLIMKYSISKISKQNTIETIRNENI